MKAVRIHEYGGPEVLRYEEAPMPEPDAGMLRIRVIAAGVNPVDWKVRQGKRAQPPTPLILGVDVAGVVDSVGAEVEAFQPGARVFAKLSSGQGGYAEYTVTSPAQVALMPSDLGFIEAAAIPTAGLAAWQALFDHAKLASGQTVLIHGATGGVGSFAVQFATWRGARVIGTASGVNVELAKRLGANEVIDYRTQRFEEIVHDVDVVLDTVGGDTFERSWGVLKPGGILVTLVAKIPEGAAASHGVRAASFVTTADGGELGQIATLVDNGAVTPIVTTVLPLSEARKAHEMSESGHTSGKIVLRVAEDPQ